MPRSARSKSPTMFLRSINAEHDNVNVQILSSYLVTPNAIRTTKRILETLLRGDGGAWTITGAFGTGKSAFIVFLSNLLRRPNDKSTSRAVALLRTADSELANEVLAKVRRKFNLVPIVVSGAPEPISSAISRSILEANRKGLLRLNQKLKKRIQQFLTTDEKTSAYSHDFVDAVHELVTVAKTNRGPTQGILLLIDELGKLLEYAARYPHKSDPFVLQQLAEISARSEGKLLILAALHQDFRAYASSLTPSERVEWEKIRGRFEDIAFEEPPDQLLRFVALAWDRIQQKESIKTSVNEKKAAKTLAHRLWDCGLAPPTLSKKDGVALLGMCAPLHPLTAYILGPLFRRIGQNERSAFTFLASQEPRALRSWISQTDRDRSCLFDVVDLYRYLVSSLGNSILNTIDAKRWAEAFEAEARHPELGAEAIAVLRTVALISASSRWLNIRASSEVIEYALFKRLTPKQIKTALRELESMSLIVHRRYNDSYILWAGSDIDIEARLAEGRQRLTNKGSVAALLRRHYTIRPVLARRHSFEKGTLRFFDVDFLTTDDLLHRRWSSNNECDGHIMILLPKNRDDRKTATDVVKKLDANNIVMRTIDAEDQFASYALELAAVDWVKRNTPELDHDATARRELHARTVSIQRSLDQFIVGILCGNSHVQGEWYHGGNQFTANNARALNEKLSIICDRIYSKSPRIDNEIINRRQLSSAAASARRNLIQKMIEASDQPHLDLTGNPPERSIYRSLLGSEGGLGLHREVKGTWSFRKPPQASCAVAAYSAIDQFLDEAIKEPKPVHELFDLLRQPPYGLRDGPIPILVCAVLLARETEVALYESGVFCPVLTAAIMDRLIKSPERFSLRRWQLSGIRKHVFEELERIVLGNTTPNKSRRRRMLRVVRPLLGFISSLPQYTMQTADLSPRTRAVRDAFWEATEPDILLFKNLPEACGLRPFSARQPLKTRSGDISAYVKAIRNTFHELRNAYPQLLQSMRISLAEGFGLSSEETSSLFDILQANAANLSEYVVEPDLKLLLSRILERHDSEDSWLESIASFLAEQPVAKWRDEDRAHFNIRLRQFVRRIRLLEATINDRPQVSIPKSLDSIRVSLTGTSFGQLDYSVHLDKKCKRKLKKIQADIEEAISNIDSVDPTIAVGALCQVLTARLQNVGTDTGR